MKLKYNFVITDMGDEFAAVAVGEGAEAFHGMIRLNNEAKAVFELLNQNDMSVEAMAKKLKAEYSDSTIDEIKEKIESFIEQLKSANLIAD